MSTGAVLVPAGGATAAGWQASLLVVSGSAASHWADALLLLSCLGCTAVLAWGTAAAVAGVREGWRTAGPTAATSRSEAAAPWSPGHRPTVAALVAAILSAGPATAAAEVPPVPVELSTPGTEPTPGPGPATEPSPGSWAALAHPVPAASASVEDVPPPGPTTADQAFRAPRAVDPASAALVTGHPVRPAPQVDAEVVVHAGDTLWALAAEHLGPGATDDEVARAWPSWWQANRAVIGDDPDLLLPGQRLVVPAG